MTRQIIRTSDAPRSPLYSQAIKVGSTVYVSGTVGIDPRTNQVAGSTRQFSGRFASLKRTGASSGKIIGLAARPRANDSLAAKFACARAGQYELQSCRSLWG